MRLQHSTPRDAEVTPGNPTHRWHTGLASGWTWLLLAAGILVVFPLTLIWRFIGWPVDRACYYSGRLFRLAAVLMTKGTPRWQFEVRGQKPADPRNPYVVVSNHESFADIILLSHLPWEMKWLSKIELLRIPILGWTMWAVRDIGVDRGKRSSARDAMNACRQRLSRHVSVMIFPEGTRSASGELLPFKDGAFRLALDAGVPILPLALAGTRQAIAKGAWELQPAHAIVEILSPIPSEGKDLATLKQEVREVIVRARQRLLNELQQE